MADFDPDAYLSGGAPQQEAPASSFDPDAFLAGDDNGSPPEAANSRDGRDAGARDARPAPEGPFASGVREFAHSVLPGLAGAAVAPLGAAAGSVIPVAGTFMGGAAAFVGGSMAAEAGQDKFLKDVVGYNDDPQRQANREANPKSSFGGGLAGGLATMSPVSTAETIGKQVLQRGFGAAAMGGFEAGGEALQGEDFDPSKIAMAALGGAVFPGVNKLGEKVQGPAEKYLAGRPGRTANPAADQAHADVGDDTVETAVGDSSLAESPPRPTGDTVGAPVENRPTNSQGEVATGAADASYAKGAVPQDAANDMLTQGDMDPATKAALDAAAPEAPVANEQPAPAEQPPAPPQAAAPEQAAPEAQPQQAPQVVDAGFPKPGEPVAVGENEATKLPADMPAKAAAAIAKSKAAQQPPEIKGKSATPTEGQKEAGNYLKARTHDFGKPIAIETHAGEVRKGTGPDGPWENMSPYEYGYFNKTKSSDSKPGRPEGIDFMRPKDGSPELGDKHFIVDQKDATTGKYDEPKAMTYYASKDMALDAYNRGFSDGKGPDRLHDITEVSRGDLVKYLAKHTSNPPKGPYSKTPIAKAPKPVAERAAVKDAIAKFEAKGDVEKADMLRNAPDSALAAIAGKRTRKYGVGTGASAGYPVEGIVNSEGGPVTANTKAKAAERSAAHKAQQDWFEKSAPKDGETDGDLLNRIKGAKVEGWQPAHKPKEWMLAQEAKKLLAKPTPGNVTKFRDAERYLRGDDASVKAYRDSKRVDADVAMNKRGGDEKVASAENALHLPGKNDVEDTAIAAIDAKNKGRFDVPHEEAESMVKPTPVKSKADLKELPRKTIHVNDSELAKVDLKKVDEGAARRKAEIDALVGKKAKIAEPKEKRYITLKDGTKELVTDETPASKGKPIKVADPAEMQRLIEMSNKAAKKSSLSDDEIANQDLSKQADIKPRDTSTVKRLFDAFNADESGSLNLTKLRADIKKLLKTTPAKSYRVHDPVGPAEEHALTLSEDLNKVDKMNTRHRLNALEWAHDVPATKDQLSEIYHAREADSAHVDLPGKQAGKTNIESLSPELKNIWDKHLEPMAKEVSDFKDAIRKLDPDRLGPDVEHYQSRITKGDTSEYNMLKGNDDPTQPHFNGLSVNASMANERPFVALERVADGKRFVIQNKKDGGGFTIWDKYKGTRIKDPGYAFEANQPYTVKGKNGDVDYIMREAMTKEIEAHARGRDGKGKPMKYFDNAALSIALAHAKLGTMARNLTELARISSTPEFQAMTTRNPGIAKEKGWVETAMPNFKGLHMEPDLAHVLDDYAKPGFHEMPLDSMRKLNNSLTKLLFWWPLAHIRNVGEHWFTGRGWDWITPGGYHSLAVDGARAIRSVMTQDKYQFALSEHGAGTIYPSVLTRNFIENIAKSVGEKIERDPGSYGKLLNSIGAGPALDAVGKPLKKISDAIYNGSSHMMWAANDIFLTQRVMELERKGYSMAEAVKKAEKDIPNYRVSPKLLGSRLVSKMMQDSLITSFGRYHSGMINAYGNMFKETLGTKSTIGDRIEGLGKFMALGLLASVVYPVLDKGAQLVTGNEDAKINRRGPMSIPYHAGRAIEGKEDIASPGRSALTAPMLTSTLLEAKNNKDWRGKSIVEPGDVAAGFKGDFQRGGKALVQEIEHFARGLISPLGTLSSAEKKYKDDSSVKAAGEGLRDQLADVHNPSQAAVNYERKQGITNDRASRSRDKKGGYGPLEGLYDRITK